MAYGKASEVLEFEILGEKQFKVSLGRMSRALGDLRPFWDEGMRPSFIFAEIQQFASQGSEGRHGAWKDLSPKYAAWKAKHYPGKGLMVRTGALKSALTGGAGHVFESHPNWMAIGASSDYGTLHQRGSGHLPRRRLIDISASQEKQMFGRFFGLIAHELNLQWSAVKDMRS